MTMGASPQAVEYLSSLLFKQKEAITYHVLANQLKIHHAKAKDMLYKFYEVNKDKLRASFIITGSRRNSKFIKLVRGEEYLEKECSGFDGIDSIHVYWVQLKDASFVDEEIVIRERKATVDHDDLNLYYRRGIISVSSLNPVSEKRPTKKTEANEKLGIPPATSTPSLKPTVKSAGLTSGYTSRKSGGTNKTEKANTSADVKPADSSSRTKKRSSTEPAGIAGYQYKSRKSEKQQPKERVIMSNPEAADMEVENEETPRRSLPNQKKESDLQQLFMDDDFSESESEQPYEKGEPIHVEQPPEEPVKEESVNKEKGDRLSAEIPDHARAPPPTTLMPQQDTVDEDGFITSYRSNKTPGASNLSDALKTPERRPENSSRKSTSRGRSDKKQTSLTSFFKKS